MVYAYDFCKTIVRKNTTLDFLRFYASVRKYFWFKLLITYFLGKFLLTFKLINENTYTKVRVLSLFGERKRTILEVASLYRKYLNDYLMLDINDKILAESESNKVYIISNSLNFIVDSFYTDVNVNVIASKLEFLSEFCLGTYNTYLLDEGKEKHFRGIESEELEEYWTDDLEADADICKISNHVFYVHDNKVVKCGS